MTALSTLNTDTDTVIKLSIDSHLLNSCLYKAEKRICSQYLKLEKLKLRKKICIKFKLFRELTYF